MSGQIKPDDKAARLREMRGRGLVARDAVRRDGKGYVVSELSLRNGGRKREYSVSKDENGNLICTCAGFRVEMPSKSDFACEHIHAARLWKQQHAEPDDIWRSSDDVARTEGKAMVNAREVEAKLNGSKEQQTIRAVTQTDGKGQQEFKNVLQLLRQPVDEKLIRVREGWTDRTGKKHLVEYIEWHTVADLLDRICPSWSHSVKSISEIGETVAVVASLTINGVTREGVGTGAGSNETGIKKAEHDALKRAAVKFGIARDLYQREGESAVEADENRTKQSPKSYASNPAVGDPVSKSMNDLITPKQLGMIRRLARDSHLDAESECQTMYRCKVEDLNKRAASKLIETLMSRAGMSKQTVARAS